VALLAARALPDDVALVCAASDGRDGSSGSAGAWVTAAAVRLVEAGRADGALARFDDAPLHVELGTALAWAETGTNLADVHVVARAR
jgi:hydroxypyruvate reductase